MVYKRMKAKEDICLNEINDNDHEAIEAFNDQHGDCDPKLTKDDGDIPSFIYRFVKTIVLISIWVAFGLYLEITGPTLIDLKLRAGTNYETIARSISGRSFGEFVGSLIGGILVDRILSYVDFLIAVCMALAAIVTVTIPYVPKVELLWLCVFIQGANSGIVNVAGNRVVLLLWKEKATSPMHIMHFGYGIGSFIVPLIANPFLAVTTKITSPICNITETYNGSTLLTNITSVTNNMTFSSRNLSSIDNCTGIPNPDDGIDSVKILAPSAIEYAYGIVAVPALIIAIIFCSYQFCFYRPLSLQKVTGPKNHKRSFKRQLDFVNPATCAGGDFWYGLQIFTLMILFYFNTLGGERLCSKFVRAFAIDNFNFSNSEGSYVNTAFWISFAIGRFTGFAVGKWIPIRIMLLIEIVGLFVSTLILAIFGGSHPVMYWVFMQPVGFFTAQLYPTGMSWIDYHVELTGIGIMINCFSGGLGGVTFLWVIGYFYDNYGPTAFLYHLLSYGSFACIVGFTMHFLGKSHGSRYDKK